MTLLKALTIVLTFSVLATKSFSQDTKLLDPMPSTKDDFVKSEPAIIGVIEWLENTPLNQEIDKRKSLNAILLAWITNSPIVTIEVNTKITPLSKKNPDLLAVFLGGWTKYALQNSYSKDPVKCNLAGIKSVVNLYKTGVGIKKDKDLQKLVDLDSKNELESWITSQLGQK